MLLMMLLPAWALLWQLFAAETGWFWSPGKHALLLVVGLVTLGLQVWMAVEAIILWPSVRGVLEEALPPLPARAAKEAGGQQ
jgi:carbon starvation protein